MINESDKIELMKYVPDENLCVAILRNIDFVEKYLDNVDSTFPDADEKGLAYKQLLIMTFSTLEAVWKSIAQQIIVRCNKRKCKNCCEYKKYETLQDLNYESAYSVLMHLQYTRLLYLSPNAYKSLLEIKNERNYVHLFKQTTDTSFVPVFDRKSIDEGLELFYETISQCSLLDDYFFQIPDACIKERDGDCYNENKLFLEKEYSHKYSFNAYSACIKLFWGEQLTKDEQHYLSSIKERATDHFDPNLFVKLLGLWLFYKGAHYKTDEAYQQAIKDFFNRLKKYIPTSGSLIKQLKEEINKNYSKYCTPVSS